MEYRASGSSASPGTKIPGDTAAEEKFKEAAEAYAVLSDVQKALRLTTDSAIKASEPERADLATIRVSRILKTSSTSLVLATCLADAARALTTVQRGW